MAKETDEGRSAEDEERDGDRPNERDDDDRPRRRRRNGGRPRTSARAVAERAKRELGELMDREPEAVSSIQRDEDGWIVTLEFLELERVPSTTDVLASYEAVIDEDGELVSYQRLHRYVRGQADGG